MNKANKCDLERVMSILPATRPQIVALFGNEESYYFLSKGSAVLNVLFDMKLIHHQLGELASDGWRRWEKL